MSLIKNFDDPVSGYDPGERPPPLPPGSGGQYLPPGDVRVTYTNQGPMPGGPTPTPWGDNFSPDTSQWGAAGQLFSDPYTQQYEQLANQTIPQWMMPQSFGNSAASLQQLFGGAPGYTAPGGFTSAGTVGGGPGHNQTLDEFLQMARARIAQLKEPYYSPNDLALLQTQMREPLEQQRSARKQQALERSAARGLGPSSGLTEIDTRDIDRAFDQLIGGNQRDIALQAITGGKQQAAMAQDVAQQILGAGATEAGIGQRSAQIANEAALRGAEMANQYALGSAGMANQFNLGRYGQQAGLAEALSRIGLQEAMFNQNRQNSAIELAQNLSQLPIQRLQLALGAMSGLNQDTGAGRLTDEYARLAGVGEAANQGRNARNQANTANMWRNLLALIGQLGGGAGDNNGLPGTRVPNGPF